jgi:hypothetical protein
MRVMVLLVVALGLGSCGIARAHPSAQQQCEGLRLALEADERKYESYSNRLDRAFNPARTYDVTVRNR